MIEGLQQELAEIDSELRAFAESDALRVTGAVRHRADHRNDALGGAR